MFLKKETTNPKLPIDNSVEFQNVKFHYKDSLKNAVDGISMKIDAGEQVAFVGPSGGGKTTSASLVSRFWDVSEGKILIAALTSAIFRKPNFPKLFHLFFKIANC